MHIQKIAVAGWALAGAALLIGEALGQDRPPWWDEAWPRREILEISTPDPSGAINTALAVVDTEGLCAPDGRDVRVVDAEGRPVPHEVLSVEEGVVRLHFLASSGAQVYSVYYGRPDAPAERHSWEKRLGSLHLKVLRNPTQRPPWSWEQMQALLAQATEVMGEGPRRCIDDGENPFAKTLDDQDHYIGVYTGHLFCPEDGWYTFATNSDDASFLRIDGWLKAQVAGGSDVKGSWDACPKGFMKLTAGVHRIEYYHVEATGGQLARAGWKPPSAKTISTIAPAYFLRELRTRSIAREDRTRAVNAFFGWEELPGAAFNRSAEAFCPVAFSDRSLSAHGAIMLREWDFGDGSPGSDDPAPLHVYAGAGEYTVSLSVWDAYGLVGRCSRTVRPGERPPDRIALFLEVDPGASVVGPTEPVSLRVRSGVIAHDDVSVRLRVEGRDDAGRTALWREEPLVLPKAAVSIQDVEPQVVWRETAAPLGPALPTGEVSVSLLYQGVPVARETVRVIGAREARGPLRLYGKALRDAQGRCTVLRVGTRRGSAPDFAIRAARGDAVRLLVIDDFLSPDERSGEGGTYYDLVAEAIRRAFRRVRVEVRRVGEEIYAEDPPRDRLARAPAIAAEWAPDAVIVAPGVSDLLALTPETEYERTLWALAERLAAECDAAIVLVTPPPLMVNPGLSRRVAYATKRVAARLGLPVADAYSAFALQQEPWERLYRDPLLNDEVYSLCPNPQGQAIIAARVFGALLPDLEADLPVLRQAETPRTRP